MASYGNIEDHEEPRSRYRARFRRPLRKPLGKQLRPRSYAAR